MQLTHYNTHFKEINFPITLICDHVTNAPNLGSLFRTADAFGIEKLELCCDENVFGRKMAKTSRATEKFIPYKFNEHTLEVVKDYKRKGYYIISLEITTESKSIDQFEFPSNDPIALVIGDENFGVSEEVLKISDVVVHIDMYGKNSSMNVVQATTIALYEMIKQRLK